MSPCHGRQHHRHGVVAQNDVEQYHAQTKIARKLASLIIDNDLCLYSQWFPGKTNAIADSLSLDFDISFDELPQHYLTCFPTQLPKNFQISPLPDEITSFVFQTLSELKRGAQSPEERKTSELHPGAIGKPSSAESDGREASFWMDAQEANATPLSATSPNLEDSLGKMDRRCPLDTSKIPLETYHRPFVSLGD